MRTMLFGLDGATFTVLDDMVQRGVMPNLARLYEQGARLKLASTVMPITPQAWTSLATGRTAGHHGVHDFIRAERTDKGIFWRLNDSRDCHCETIWQYATRKGRRVTVLNYFGMAPAKPLNGHSIPGFTSGRHLRLNSYPPDLFSRLEQIESLDIQALGLDYEVERQALQEMPPEQWLEWIDHHIHREQIWFRVLEHLMRTEPSDLTAIVLDGVDKIQHLAWRYLDPALVTDDSDRHSAWEKQVIDRCRDYFAQVDRFLGRVMELIGQDSRLIIASDHGFTATTQIVYINKWLHDQGYLHWRESVREDEVEALFSDRLADLAAAIDLSRTKAYALTPSCNGIYINVPDEEYDAFRHELTAGLRELKGPDGRVVVTDVKWREEHLSGPYVNRMPDLTLTLSDHGLVSVLNSTSAVVPRKQPSGTHHPDGVLIAGGPGIRREYIGERVSILDVAPLLLHGVELPIPAAMEGRLPAELYEEDFLAEHPCTFDEAVEEQERAEVDREAAESDLDDQDKAVLMDRLRSLGYIE